MDPYFGAVINLFDHFIDGIFFSIVGNPERTICNPL